MSGTGMGKKYKCVFFDLDHTLWDYDTNSRDTLRELYDMHALSSRGISDPEVFYQQFRKVNLALWDLYDTNQIDQAYIRAERFRQILEHFSVYDEKLSDRLSEDYLSQCPKKPNLIPHALDVLEYLTARYTLTIVTNGFEEIQHLKLSSGKLLRFFEHIVTSQKAGHRKPSEKIFEFALLANAAKCCDVVMIGDNLLTDIAGARNASIDTIYYNPGAIAHNANVSYEIACLSELKKIL